MIGGFHPLASTPLATAWGVLGPRGRIVNVTRRESPNKAYVMNEANWLVLAESGNLPVSEPE